MPLCLCIQCFSTFLIVLFAHFLVAALPVQMFNRLLHIKHDLFSVRLSIEAPYIGTSSYQHEYDVSTS